MKAAVWVKLHDVPMAAYTDDGLSMLASIIGTTRLPNSYTTSTWSDNWGRSSYARALIEISAEYEFKDVLTMAIPDLDGGKYVTKTIDVEYEWKPPRCAHVVFSGMVLMLALNRFVLHLILPLNRKLIGMGLLKLRGGIRLRKVGFKVSTRNKSLNIGRWTTRKC